MNRSFHGKKLTACEKQSMCVNYVCNKRSQCFASEPFPEHKIGLINGCTKEIYEIDPLNGIPKITPRYLCC